MKTEEKKSRLSPVICKQLYQQIESSGGSRNDFDLRELVNTDTILYGENASARRRAVQFKFNKLKQMHPQQYLTLLQRSGVIPSEKTTEEYRTFLDMGREEVEPSESGLEEVSSDEDEEELSEVGSAINESIGSSSNRTPPPSKSRTPPRSAIKPPPTVSTATPNTNGYVFGQTSALGATPSSTTNDLSWSSFQDGTQLCPFLEFVNPHRPEAHHDLFIQRVEGMKNEHHKHNGWHIGKILSPLDFLFAKASIPQLSHYPKKFRNRLVLIKLPSLSSWMKDHEHYHANGTVDCIATKEAHASTVIAVEGTEREFIWTLIVFPFGVVLDNQIFSHDNNEVTPNYNKLYLEPKLNKTKKELRAMNVFWRIAEAGGKRISKTTIPNTAEAMWA
jgi:hypothetical protein